MLKDLKFVIQWKRTSKFTSVPVLSPLSSRKDENKPSAVGFIPCVKCFVISPIQY